VTVLHRFDPSNGRFPYGRLVLASNGLLYGTTSSGASGEAGTVYRLSTDGTGFKTLVEFAGTTAGCQPKAGLVQADNGRLYGATESCAKYSSGAVYSVSMKGALRTVYQFNPDGYAMTGKNPTAELLQGPDGNLYGTTRLGGKHPDVREGEVFRIGLSGAISVSHTFTGTPDGAQPSSGLVTGPDGDLYGVTPVGGEPMPGFGVVYRLARGRHRD
jgi:uncharacterized repeat protein (TIGR03803 family)